MEFFAGVTSVPGDPTRSHMARRVGPRQWTIEPKLIERSLLSVRIPLAHQRPNGNVHAVPGAMYSTRRLRKGVDTDDVVARAELYLTWRKEGFATSAATSELVLRKPLVVQPADHTPCSYSQFCLASVAPESKAPRSLSLHNSSCALIVRSFFKGS